MIIKYFIKRFRGFYMSLGMFTAIPLPYNKWDDKCVGLMIPCMPLTGAVIGFIWAGISKLLFLAEVPPPITSAALSLAPFLLTGFLHLDGFMDTCDAVLSRRSLDEKLRILKDPHTGAFAVIAMGALFITQFAALSALTETLFNPLVLIFIPVISRAFSSLAVLNLKPMPQSGYVKMFHEKTKPSHRVAAIVFISLCALLVAYFLGLYGVIIFFTMGGVFVLALFLTCREFSGISGDLTGFALVISELAGLLAWALL